MVTAAGWMTLQGLDERQHEGHDMHAALRMHAMQVTELQEFAAVKEQVEYAHLEEGQLRQDADELTHEAAREDHQAQQVTARAQAFQNASEQDHEMATIMADRVNATEQERLVLLQTLQDEERAEQELRQQLRDAAVHNGICDTKGFSMICQWIGGITQLQKQADEIDVEIHRDMEQLAVTDRYEFLQIIVVQALQHQADHYQQVADDLIHTAAMWSLKSKADANQAAAFVLQVESVEQETDSLEQQGRSYHDSIDNMTRAVQDMVLAAHQHEQASKNALIISLVLLMLPLAFFIYRCMTGFMDALHRVGVVTRECPPNATELCRAVCSFVLHGLFFLAAVTACQDSVAHLEEYSTVKRAVVLLDVALLGSLAQSFWLQAVPHCLLERPWKRSHDMAAIVWMIVKLFLLRLALLMPCFVMEFLVVWLGPFRSVVLNVNPVVVYASFVVALYLYFLYWEPVSMVVSDQHNDHSTVNQDDDEQDEDSVKENTPLKSANHSTVTELFPEFVMLSQMTGCDENVSTHYSLNSSSPYHVDVSKSLHQLFFLMESFVLFCLLVNLNLNLELLLPAYYVKVVYIALGCVSTAVYVAVVYVARRCGADSLARKADFDFSAKVVDV